MSEAGRGTAAGPLRSATADWVRALERTATVKLDGTHGLAQVVDESAACHGTRPALLGEDAVLTYADLAALANRCARWARSIGLGRGDRVALLMGNEPAYAAIWIGLGRVGVVTALLNPQLAGGALARDLATASARHLIIGAELRIADGLPGEIGLWSFGAALPGATRLDEVLAALPGTPLDAGEVPPPALREAALLVYTSGTTGPPKAAVVSHYRVMMWSAWFAALADAGPDDRLYDCLPMCHAVGGIVAIGSMLVAGGTVIVRRGFSARRFWPDVVASGATIFQYIGELCRYLAAAPPCDDERRHRLRLCCGNGLRADTWTRFAERFAPPRILEFYAATEGSFSLFNVEGRVGALGRVPPFMAHRSPVALVRVDPSTGGPLRDGEGRCLRCLPGETGEAIGRVVAGASDLATRFEGYTSAAETERKILRDVFRLGDSWFRTGDLMTRDAGGFFFFVDRIGDTFRWKGENVATSEVADALMTCPGVSDAVVYGIAVPHADGRAGMAALVIDATAFDLDALHARLAVLLPRYARPVCLRLVDHVRTTGTFRPLKGEFAADGFDPARIGDPLFAATTEGYQPLDGDLYRLITEGMVRL